MIDTHYKDRLPKETIQIIENFFNKKNLQLSLIQDIKSEGNTYSCHYELLFHNKRILTSNGKGITQELSQASAYAEMYERFCGATENINGNFINYKKYQEKNLKKYNYHISNQEKLMTSEDIKNDIYINNSFISHIATTDEEMSQIIENYLGKELYAIKYNSLNPKVEDKYFNSFFISSVVGTNGFAAGNTLEEALVQGISEIFERYVLEEFFKRPQFIYYYLNPNNLSSYLQDIINSIENQGYKIKIYDLSYNFNMPVCVAIIQDVKNHDYFFCFGASPIIDIAIERTLTEVYQGRKILINKNSTIHPSFNMNWADFLYQSFTSQTCDEKILPENLILYSKEKQEYNKKIFLSKEEFINNKELLNYTLLLAEKNNINLFYKDISLCKDIVAVRIISDQLLNFYLQVRNNNILSYFSDEQKKIIVKYYIILLKQINNKNIDEQILTDLKNEITPTLKENINLYNFFFSLLFCDLFDPFRIQLQDKTKNYMIIKNLLLYKDYQINRNNLFYEKVFPYQLINSYFSSGLDKKEIQKYLEFLGYFNIPIKKYSNKNIVKNYIIQPMVEYYSSQEYNEYLELFMS